MDILIKTLSLLCLFAAINCGLIGFFNFDLISAVFGSLSRVIYAVIGAGAVTLIVLAIVHFRRETLGEV